MIKEVAHIGITISNMEQSIKFYRDVLGLKLVGEMVMEGKETDALFNKENIKLKVAYLNGSDELIAPPIELLQFVSPLSSCDQADLFKTSISEICFSVVDIEATYARLKAKGVHFISAPQYFDFTKYGFSKSKALYFKDPDGIILELIQSL